MVVWDHEGGAEFPFDKEDVFEALVEAITNISGMEIDKFDVLSGKIIVKNGITLTYRGEDIPIYVKEVSPGITRVSVNSTPENGFIIGRKLDLGKNRKNIEKIFDETSKILNQKNLTDSKSHKHDQPALATVKCPHCGKYNMKEAKFCVKCGRVINNDNQSELNSCPYCGKENKKEAIYCTGCGNEINNNQSELKSCPFCGKENRKKAKFCAKCGRGIENISKSESKSCSTCGAENPNHADFCIKCGNALNNGSTGIIKVNNLEDLEKLAELKEKGIISEEEFQAKKKQILGL